jgi:hypothetical protein
MEVEEPLESLQAGVPLLLLEKLHALLLKTKYKDWASFGAEEVNPPLKTTPFFQIKIDFDEVEKLDHFEH